MVKSMMKQSRHHLYRPAKLLLLSLGLFATAMTTSYAEQEYLYNAMPEGESDPIIDYVPPSDNSTKNSMGGSELEEPSFLFSKTGPGAVSRIVEFYAPWCPHCQHFAPKYVKFARRMREIVKPYNLQVDFYAVSCTANKRLCKHLEIHGYPTVKVIRAGSNNATSIKYFDLHPFQVLRDIGIEVDMVDEHHVQEEAEQERHLKSKGKGSDAKKFVLAQPKQQKRNKAEIYSDAYKSFHFAMKTGVFMTNGALPNKTGDVLHDWLNLLQDTLPPTWNIHRLLDKLLEEFEAIVQGEDHMLAILDQFPPANEWSLSLTHGQEAMGYTGGLWELFHIMTVGVVEYNEKVVTDDGYAFYRTEAVADDLRNYIANFFGCEVCRMNFLHSYDNCGLDRCNRLSDHVGDLASWKQLPLWLYEMHNAVNVRLMKEQAERDNRISTHDDEVHVQWPSRLDCPNCWNSDGAWDEDLIFLYLRDTYWPDEAGKTKDESRRFLFLATVEPDDIGDENHHLFPPSYAPLVTFAIIAIIIVFSYKKWIHLRRRGGDLTRKNI